MKLEDLIRALPEHTVRRTSLADRDCEIHNVSFLTGSATSVPRSDVLYFSDAELLPSQVSESSIFSCIVIGGVVEDSPLEEHSNVNLIWLENDSDLFACYNTIQSVFLEDQQYSSIMRRLLAAHFSNQGLQYLIEEAAIALNNPIVVVDPMYRYIAYHLGNLHDGDSQLARIMTEEIANETVLENAVAYIRDSRIDAQIARSKGPYEHFNEILGCNTMTLAVMVRGVCIAHVMIMEDAHRFTELDRDIFVKLASFVAQELQKSEVWGPTSGELGSYFLETILQDRSPSIAVTMRRMKSLNFHPKPLLFVACLHAPGEGLSATQTEHIAAQLRPMLHHSLYTRHHQQLVCLISRDEDEGLSVRSVGKLRDVALLNGLSVGISNAFRSITDTRNAYDQARAAIKYGDMATNSIEDNSL